MATVSKERLTGWLRDAHTMEQQADSMLESLAERLDTLTAAADMAGDSARARCAN